MHSIFFVIIFKKYNIPLTKSCWFHCVTKAYKSCAVLPKCVAAAAVSELEFEQMGKTLLSITVSSSDINIQPPASSQARLLSIN